MSHTSIEGGKEMVEEGKGQRETGRKKASKRISPGERLYDLVYIIIELDLAILFNNYVVS